MFSKACEYGIRATIFVAQQSMTGQRASLKEIASEIESPIAFTAKILQQLAKNDVLLSSKGKFGGFEIPIERIEEVTLCNIVDAIDGDTIYRGCALGLKQCNSEKPCPAHERFVEIRDNLQSMLENTSLKQLIKGLDLGHTYLKR